MSLESDREVMGDLKMCVVGLISLISQLCQLLVVGVMIASQNDCPSCVGCNQPHCGILLENPGPCPRSPKRVD